MLAKKFQFRPIVMTAVIAGLLVLSGCESTGTIEGVSAGKPVKFDYKQGFLDTDGGLNVVMPDGEKFSGKFVQQSSARSGDEWVIGEGSRDDGLILTDSTDRSSSAKAILLGDRGNTMKCQFQFSKPRWGIEDGGIGECKVSDGREVNIAF